MLEFKIIKKSKKSKARLGLLSTSHGVVETPSLVPVATQASVKTLESQEANEAGCQILIANTFHLHLKPGEDLVKKAGSLHRFMSWQGPLMTDSGGFQVFSLGFGRDFGVGKIINDNGQNIKNAVTQKNSQPKFLKITSDGVLFWSPIDGKKLFLGPKESIEIQEKLGADIIFAFDECTPPLASFEYVKESLKRTHKWEKICSDNKKSKQALFGIVQGSGFKELRQESAKFINSLDFDGFGIGGDFGESRTTQKVLNWVLPCLDDSKPRHLLGVGHLKDIEEIIKSGVDLFDCTVPTHYARRGICFTSKGRLDLKRASFLTDKKPLDENCFCRICAVYKRNYICHLLRAREITPLKMLTFHNLYFFNNFVRDIRSKIKEGKM